MEAGNWRQEFYGPLSRPAPAPWEPYYLAYVTVSSCLGALAGDHWLVYSSGSIQSELRRAGAALMTLHIQKVTGPGLRRLEADHQQGEPWQTTQRNTSTRGSFFQVSQSLTHCSLSAQSEKLLGYLGRSGNSSKISMYHKNSSSYRNQRLKWPMKVSCPPTISTGLVLKELW